MNLEGSNFEAPSFTHGATSGVAGLREGTRRGGCESGLEMCCLRIKLGKWVRIFRFTQNRGTNSTPKVTVRSKFPVNGRARPSGFGPAGTSPHAPDAIQFTPHTAHSALVHGTGIQSVLPEITIPA